MQSIVLGRAGRTVVAMDPALPLGLTYLGWQAASRYGAYLDLEPEVEVVPA